MLETIKEKTFDRWFAVAVPDERIFGLYLLSALVLAFLSWLYYRKLEHGKRPEKMEKGFFAYLFDRDIFLHRSAIQDYIYFLANGLIYSGLISQILISTHFFMIAFYGGLEGLFGAGGEGYIEGSLWTIALYTIVYAALLDFAIFITHFCQHKIPILWEFHKVHHSAEVLTPMTLYRMHPVDLFFSGFVASMLAGLGFAGFYYLTGDAPDAYEVMGLNIIVFAFYLAGYNLRHSHIWLNYPGWLSHILISPAQHQIHHSTAIKHFDKNLGLIFAFWDRLFGTLYVPKGYEKISYGINKAKPNPFKNVRDMYLQPFKNAWKIICPDNKALRKGLVFAVSVLFFAALYLIFLSLDRVILEQSRPLSSVHTEELTWTEVQRSLNDGSIDTIIIPTGGTEQGGPHLVLGKHNYIVRHNAGEIAKRLGTALVAPVIAYVPEDIHMDWAGTITVPENIYEGLLEAAAESHIKHGFKYVLFVGDSHGNQDGQRNAAERLSQQYKGEAVIVHVGDYYAANGQMEWLMEQGHEKNTIGGHAGIRDTAEIMHIHPEGLRRAPVIIKDRAPGHNGNPTLATPKIGKRMTEMKIEAALKQIRKETGKEEQQTDPAKAAEDIYYVEP